MILRINRFGERATHRSGQRGEAKQRERRLARIAELRRETEEKRAVGVEKADALHVFLLQNRDFGSFSLDIEDELKRRDLHFHIFHVGRFCGRLEGGNDRLHDGDQVRFERLAGVVLCLKSGTGDGVIDGELRRHAHSDLISRGSELFGEFVIG